MKPPIIILTGPTAVGKTSLSIRLAKALNGEVISADSMQVYHHMDIGSAKITREEMEGIPHHLIDVLEPTVDFHVAQFQKMAKEALALIYKSNKIPIVTGGTGFYIQALLYDIDFSNPRVSTSLREEIEAQMAELGAEVMHRHLQEIDPESANAIPANNQKRVIRAIEYYKQTGERISVHNQRERAKESPFQFLYYVANRDRVLLYERINRRIDQMIDSGLVAEVEKLRDMGCSRSMTSMQGLGYKEILSYLEGTCSLEEAVTILKRDTRHFAKRQITWFKRERDVRWLNLSEEDPLMNLALKQMLQEISESGIGTT